MAYKSFEGLDVWRRACRLATTVYQTLKESRENGLKDQMNCAAISVASTIAEGYERNTDRNVIRFRNIPKGSAAELRTQAYTAERIGVLEETEVAFVVDELM